MAFGSVPALRPLLALLPLLLLSMVPREAAGQLARSYQFEGQIGVVVQASSMRTQSNNGNPCRTTNSQNMTLTGIPAGATILGAFLYWTGSGDGDWRIRFENRNITAPTSARWTDSFWQAGTTYEFFGARADVTSYIQGNETLSFSNLSVDTNSPYCQVEAVQKGWAVVVVYESPATIPTLRRVDIWDGYHTIRDESATLPMSGFLTSPTADARYTLVAWEGDPTLSGGESVLFNGSAIAGGTGDVFDSSQGHGLDYTTWDVSSLLGPSQRSASIGYQSDADLLNVQLVVSDMRVVAVDVQPKGDPPVITRLPGTSYSETYTVEATSLLPGSYDLLWSYAGTQAIGYPDSVTGPGLSGALFDSTRVTIPAQTTQTYRLWYTVTAGPPATNRATLTARSVPWGTLVDGTSFGWLDVRRVVPALSMVVIATPSSVPLVPGATVTYTLRLVNTGEALATGIVLADPLPPEVDFEVGSITSSLPAGVTATASYSDDGGATWAYVPASGGCGAAAGYDGCVTNLRWVLAGDLQADAGASQIEFGFVTHLP